MLHLMLVELLMRAMVLSKKKLLPEMLMEIILHHLSTKIQATQLMMSMEHQLELELKVTIQPQELLRKRGARVASLFRLWSSCRG